MGPSEIDDFAESSVNDKLSRILVDLAAHALEVPTLDRPIKLAETTTDVDDSAPAFEAVLSNCSMPIVNITYLLTSSALLNTMTDDIIEAITPEVPALVCETASVLVNITLTEGLNTLSTAIWTALQGLEAEDPLEIFNADGFIYGFFSFTVLWLLMVACYVLIPV